MSVQGHLLDITVIGCKNLKDTEFISRQDPYVILEYASNKYRTRTDTDGGRNPSFNEKYMLPLIEGLKEINVAVWNSNTLSADDFIGSGKILLQKVLAEGYHDSTWPLTTRRGRRAGEIRVILHYTNPKGAHSVTSSGFPQHGSLHSNHAHYTAPSYPTPSAYPPSQPTGHGGHSNHAHYTVPSYPTPSAFPPSQPTGHEGYPPAYAPYPPTGHSLYPPYGAGGYAPPHRAQSPYSYPPQSYPPQAYPPYPPQDHSASYSAPYPPY